MSKWSEAFENRFKTIGKLKKETKTAVKKDKKLAKYARKWGKVKGKILKRRRR